MPGVSAIEDGPGESMVGTARYAARRAQEVVVVGGCDGEGMRLKLRGLWWSASRAEKGVGKDRVRVAEFVGRRLHSMEGVGGACQSSWRLVSPVMRRERVRLGRSSLALTTPPSPLAPYHEIEILTALLL